MGSDSVNKSAGKLFPPGFRFHPTDEELVLYYLKRKICKRPLKPDIIAEVDVYKWDPQELPGQSKLKTGDRQWYFFSPRDRKYPNGGRSSRATLNGYWKTTGKDRIIKRKSMSAGVKKTLVYYQGRAPSGLRTDWVMHEYTMSEEELSRCPVAKQYYALYKIFKKSGAGPKNGEQYGAPFVEEEWNDDEQCLDIDSFMIEKPNPGADPLEHTNTREEEETGLSSDILEFLNQVMDEPELLPPLPEFSEPNVTMPIESLSGQVEKDFIELDDLVGPEPGPCDPVTDFGLLSGLDLYDRPGSFGGQHIGLQGPYMENLDYGPENSGLMSHGEDGPGSFGGQHFGLQGLYMQNLDYGPENSGFVSEVVSHGEEVHDELPVSYVWNHHDQGDCNLLTSQMVHEPVNVSNSSSGVIVEENPEKPEYYITQRPEPNTENNNTESWFSSALWAFVDSIPTTPASASESSALMNRAFERVSSFGRGRNVKLAATAKRLEKPKPSRSNRGILYFSVLGVLCAILWVFVGWVMELSSRFKS
ncbi:NAC domain-containing protein 17-like [Bidens hawaiensis]|uniref:NAC domain-containing protein 17-like n=1 Tax=Bidens hawaiensis TaxID=980011 RepID=UPI00404B4FC0